MRTGDDKPGVILARGVCRMLADHGYVALTEFPVKTGRRMDICALGPRGDIWCIEVKSTRADYLSDNKWPEYLEWCDRLSFAVPEGFAEEILPFDHGLIRADAWGAEVMRDAPEEGLAPQRRRALTLRFARLAAERLARNAPGPAAPAIDQPALQP